MHFQKLATQTLNFMESCQCLSNNTKNKVKSWFNKVMDCDSDDDDREPEIINVDGDFV